jgi:hypothetical protein
LRDYAHFLGLLVTLVFLFGGVFYFIFFLICPGTLLFNGEIFFSLSIASCFTTAIGVFVVSFFIAFVLLAIFLGLYFFLFEVEFFGETCLGDT